MVFWSEVLKRSGIFFAKTQKALRFDSLILFEKEWYFGTFVFASGVFKLLVLTSGILVILSSYILLEERYTLEHSSRFHQ